MKKLDKHSILALFLIISSNIGWILPIFVIPVRDWEMHHKVIVSGILITYGQISYNVGLFMIGREVFIKLKEKKIDLRKILHQLFLFMKLTLRRSNLVHFIRRKQQN